MRAWERSLVLAAAALLAVGLASCGGSGDSSSSPASTPASGASPSATSAQGSSPSSTTARKAPPSGERPPSSTAGGAAEFRVAGGDNSIQEFGAEASGSELAQAAAALHGFLDARVEGDGARACSYLTGETARSFQRLAASSSQLKGKGCGPVLEALTGSVPKASLEEAAVADVGAMRVEGSRGFLLYHGAQHTDFAIPIGKEGDRWKVAALAGTPLS